MTAPLRIVPPAPVEVEPEAALSALLPRLAVLQGDTAEVMRQIDIERRRLADKRCLAFVRFEQVRAEFGQG